VSTKSGEDPSPKTGCVGPLTGKQMSNLKKGLFYLNVHSEMFPAGEIRGQVLPIIGATTRGAVAEPDSCPRRGSRVFCQ
jgi:hypothetical protein